MTPHHPLVMVLVVPVVPPPPAAVEQEWVIPILAVVASTAVAAVVLAWQQWVCLIAGGADTLPLVLLHPHSWGTGVAVTTALAIGTYSVAYTSAACTLEMLRENCLVTPPPYL